MNTKPIDRLSEVLHVQIIRPFIFNSFRKSWASVNMFNLTYHTVAFLISFFQRQDVRISSGGTEADW